MLKKSFTIILLLLVSFLISCKGIEFENQKVAEAEEFSKGEAMIFMVEEKNKYESRFGNDIWQLKSGNGEQYFKDYVVSNVKNLIEKMMKLKLVGNELNVIIGTKDMEKINKCVTDYNAALTNGDISYINCTDEDIENAFLDYHISRVVVDNLSKNATTELSISESKVIKVQYIVLSNKEEAEDIREKLKLSGASFSYYAKTKSNDTEIELIIRRGDQMSINFPELFYLSTGQVSEVFNNLDKYYIFKCINDYLVDETENRRIEILKTMKNDEFMTNYKKYDEKYLIQSNSTYWRDIDLSKGANCKIYKFNEIYYKYFPNSIK